MITVTIPAPKLRIFKCDGDDCSTPYPHWLVDAGRIVYDAPTWLDALAMALAIIRQDTRRRAARESTC